MTPRACHRLKPADEELARVVLEIVSVVRVSKHRNVDAQRGNRLAHDVKMLRRVQGHADATEPPHLARPHPSAVDNVFSLDVPALGTHAGSAPAFFQEPGDPRVFDDRAPPARALFASARVVSIGFVRPSFGK